MGSVERLRLETVRSMPLYLQFMVVLMILYATAMTVLTAVIGMAGQIEAVATLLIALVVWVFALVVVPTKLG